MDNGKKKKNGRPPSEPVSNATPSELLTTASELYAQIEAAAATALTARTEDNTDDAYWSSLPQHLRQFIKKALPLDQTELNAQTPLTHEQLSTAVTQLAHVVQSHWGQMGMSIPGSTPDRPITADEVQNVLTNSVANFAISNDDAPFEDTDHNEHSQGATGTASKKKKKKKKKSGSGAAAAASAAAPTAPAAPVAEIAAPVAKAGPSTEREKIRDFWLSLTESEQRNLVRIEKDAVVKKIKEQQRSGCSCAVCGRKRSAIEQELEALYASYYEELKEYADRQQRFVESGGKTPPPPGPGPFPGSVDSDPKKTGTIKGAPTARARKAGAPRGKKEARRHTHSHACPHHGRHSHPPTNTKAKGTADEFCDGYADSCEEEEEYYSDEEYSDEEYSEEAESADAEEEDESDELGRRSQLMTRFGRSLTVKGNILTVADDLLRNEGHKFLEMMEQLADRRIQRELRITELDADTDSEFSDATDTESEADSVTSDDGRRMFQIFAARLFEQRVQTAYREKVAADKQSQLLREFELEETLAAEREAKKQKENQKKKDKKRLERQKKEEERARLEAQRVLEEEEKRLRLEQEKKRQEEVRAQREAEKRAKEEKIRQQKEAEKKAREEKARLQRERKLKEEADRKAKEEAERKAKDEAERKAKEEAERKAREEAERKVREESERKAREESERKAREESERKAREEAERRKQKVKVRAVPGLPRAPAPVTSTAAAPSPPGVASSTAAPSPVGRSPVGRSPTDSKARTAPQPIHPPQSPNGPVSNGVGMLPSLTPPGLSSSAPGAAAVTAAAAAAVASFSTGVSPLRGAPLYTAGGFRQPASPLFGYEQPHLGMLGSPPLTDPFSQSLSGTDVFNQGLPGADAFNRSLPGADAFNHGLPGADAFNQGLSGADAFKQALPGSDAFNHIPGTDPFKPIIPSNTSGANVSDPFMQGRSFFGGFDNPPPGFGHTSSIAPSAPGDGLNGLNFGGFFSQPNNTTTPPPPIGLGLTQRSETANVIQPLGPRALVDESDDVIVRNNTAPRSNGSAFTMANDIWGMPPPAQHLPAANSHVSTTPGYSFNSDVTPAAPATATVDPAYDLWNAASKLPGLDNDMLRKYLVIGFHEMTELSSYPINLHEFQQGLIRLYANNEQVRPAIQ